MNLQSEINRTLAIYYMKWRESGSDFSEWEDEKGVDISSDPVICPWSPCENPVTLAQVEATLNKHQQRVYVMRLLCELGAVRHTAAPLTLLTVDSLEIFGLLKMSPAIKAKVLAQMANEKICLPRPEDRDRDDICYCGGRMAFKGFCGRFPTGYYCCLGCDDPPGTPDADRSDLLLRKYAEMDKSSKPKKAKPKKARTGAKTEDLYSPRSSRRRHRP